MIFLIVSLLKDYNYHIAKENNIQFIKDLIDRIAATGLTKKEAGAALDAVLEAIADSLKKGEPVLLTGFGKFEVRTRAARTGINPKTLEKIQLPATKVPAFKAGKALRAAVK